MATHMAEPPAGATDAAAEHLKLEDRVWLLRAMLMMRGIEERAMTLYRQGKGPGSFYDGYGQEAGSARAAWALAAQDRLCGLHPDPAPPNIPRRTPARLFPPYNGSGGGVTRGRAR